MNTEMSRNHLPQNENEFSVRVAIPRIWPFPLDHKQFAAENPRSNPLGSHPHACVTSHQFLARNNMIRKHTLTSSASNWKHYLFSQEHQPKTLFSLSSTIQNPLNLLRIMFITSSVLHFIKISPSFLVILNRKTLNLLGLTKNMKNITKIFIWPKT